MKERFLNISQNAVSAIDDRGDGNANHLYRIYDNSSGKCLCELKFQKGPIQSSEPNGITNEDLLSIVIDRLTGFQSGSFDCEENEEALKLVARAKLILGLRTGKRVAKDVEGRNIP